MKKNISHTLLCLLAVSSAVFLQSGCRKDHSDSYTTTYTISTPVFKERSAVMAQINGNANEPIKNAGKIYIKDKFIFLNEVDKGIHVINNSNPARPVQTAFLNIPGNQDIAIKDNTLYADMYGDLLAIDITDISHVRVTKTLSNLFLNRSMYGYAADSNMIIIDWIKKDTTVTYENYGTQCNGCYFYSSVPSLLSNSNAKSSQTGIAGSMARMVLMNDYLYAITGPSSLGIINISNAAVPSAPGTVEYAGFDLQTIYPFEGKLFMGSAVGLFMYDVSDPQHPSKLGQFSHARSCDPVVADGKFAYVTLHAGSTCGGLLNELNVINVEDLFNPSLVNTYPMTSPTGLSKDGNLLFICDGKSGIKLYNADLPAHLKLLNHIDSKEPYDIIAGNNKALVVAKDGIYQYDYSNIYNIRQLSVISVKQ